MELDLTEEQGMLRDSVRGFAREKLLPVAAQIDREGVFPRKQFEGMAELGLMGVTVPTEYDGAPYRRCC